VLLKRILRGLTTYQQATYQQATYQQATYQQATYQQATYQQAHISKVYLADMVGLTTASKIQGDNTNEIT
jgi:hypothetical protein